MRRINRRLAARRLLRAFARAHPEATFIEVGSNDGKQHDPLRPILLELPWRGVMVEPVPYVFQRLLANYGDMHRIALENVAIADRNGTMPFFHLREATAAEREGLPGWYDGIGSFRRETVLSHIRHIPDLESRLVVTEVPCMTFDALCDKHRIEQPDLLLIDTEGYDREILRGVDLAGRSPRLLVYEHFHLTPAERQDSRAVLEGEGYELLEEGFDTWCLGPRAHPEVRSVWSRLRPAVPAVHATDRPWEER